MNYNIQLYTALGEDNYRIILECVTVSFMASKLHFCCLKLVPMDVHGIQIMTDYEFIAKHLFSLFTPMKIFQLQKKINQFLNLLIIFSDMLHAKIAVTEVMIMVFNQTRNRKCVCQENEVPTGWMSDLDLQNSILTHPICSTPIHKWLQWRDLNSGLFSPGSCGTCCQSVVPQAPLV